MNPSRGPGVGRTLWRIVWVPVAFALATLAGLFVLGTLGLERLTAATGGGRGIADWIANALANPKELKGTVQLLGSLASALTLVPAMLVVIVGEVARIRSSIYYVIGGGVAVVAVPVVMRVMQSGAGAATAAPVLQVLATAGFAAGLVYWLLAGRSA